MNIRGGAALLKSTQDSLGLPTGAGTDAGQWYASVAAVSGAPDADGAADFADAAYAALTTGAARTTADGQAVSLRAQPATPQRDQLDRLGLKKPKPDPNVECPKSIPCESIPAPYVQYGPTPGAYGNHDLAARDTAAGPGSQYIVIHDTEASWDTTLKLVQDPTYVSWHYSVRSSDGLIAQHVPTKDVAWHAGNWYVNMHSIGIEHEGFAPSGATWYSRADVPELGQAGEVPRRRSTTSRWTAATSSATTRSPASPRPGWPACTGTRVRTGTGSTTSS